MKGTALFVACICGVWYTDLKIHNSTDSMLTDHAAIREGNNRR